MPEDDKQRLVRASLLALSDPAIIDGNVLHVIYALAIKHRLDGGPEQDPEEANGDDDDKVSGAA